MNKNFILADSVGIQVENNYYDLHNCFDLVGLEVDFIFNKVRVRFMPHDKECSKDGDLTISFSGVDYLDVSPGVLKNMVRDVAEVGYKNPEDFDHDWLLAEDRMNKADHLFFRMAGDEYIRVHGDSAMLGKV